MTIDFENMERPILQHETNCYKPFIGYISPNGDLIDFNNPFGESGHDGWDNTVTTTFLRYMRYSIKDTSLKDAYPRGMGSSLDENYTNFDELFDKLNIFLKYKSYGVISELKYQLLLFFRRAYLNKNFFEAIDRKIEVTSEKDFIQRFYTENFIDPHYYSHYREQIILELMSHIKDIVVCYLGYDSLERFQPNGEIIKIPHDSSGYISYTNPCSSYFYYTPRIITTSCPNINERFFNCLIMNWIIHWVPRYYFCERELRFKKVPFYSAFYTRREEILEKEIQSIKRLVPLKDRYKYFR